MNFFAFIAIDVNAFKSNTSCLTAILDFKRQFSYLNHNSNVGENDSSSQFHQHYISSFFCRYSSGKKLQSQTAI